MAVNRSIWKPTFESWPTLPCPTCKVGTLSIAEDTIFKEETASSKAARGHEAWDPEWIMQRFMAVLTCANPNCGDKVFVCGKITMDWDYFDTPEGKTSMESYEHYVPHFFEPAPPVFPIPSECPEKIGDELKKAFALIWSDVGSGGNRLRVAIETLMNERKIEKKAKIKNGPNKGKFRYLTLSERLKRFAVEHEKAATQLMAIKWLGDTGSHAALDVLTHDDLLDAFEHFEYALDLVYVKKDIALVKRAKDIIKKKGPVRVKAKRKRRGSRRGRDQR